MKIIIRAFVVALAVTGCIASTVSAHGSSVQASNKISKTLADRPTPTCALDDWQQCWPSTNSVR